MSAVQSQDNMLITSSRLRTIQTVLWTPLTVSTSVRDATRSIIGKKLGSAQIHPHTHQTTSVPPRQSPARPLPDARTASPAAIHRSN